MNPDRLIRYRFFVAWADQKEEKWLEAMAAQGWHLVQGGIRFVFQRGKPGVMRYRLDYRPTFPQGKDEYFAMFRDAGWEHVCEFGSWHYFRSPESAAAPEIFTDAETRAAKYARIIALLAIILMSQVGLMPSLWNARRLPRMSTFAWSAALLHVAMGTFLLYALIRLLIHVRRIKARRETR